MRFRSCLQLLLLLLCLPLKAQDTDFPTLDELENLETPGYDYLDVVRRFSWMDISHTPPSDPPEYEIGDIEEFRVPTVDDDEVEIAKDMVLRGMTDNVLVWIDEAERLSDYRTQWLAEEIDNTIVQPLQQLLGFTEPPGVDGDPRLYVVGVRLPESTMAGYFPVGHALPRRIWQESNQREMLVVNLSNEDKSDVFDKYFISTIAHEYQHVLLYHRDPSEEDWINEGLSTVVEHYLFGYDPVSYFAERFLEAPQTSLVQFSVNDDDEDEIFKRYGAGMLFIMHLEERFGSGIVRDLHTEPADGWHGVEKVLRENYSASADEVFADWVLANFFLDADRGFGYQSVEAPPPPPQPIATIRSFPGLKTNNISQYSTDYYVVDVRGAEQLKLRLTQSPEAHLIEGTPYEGDHFYYAVANGFSDSRLTRQIDLRLVGDATLDFRVWFDLEPHMEYGYVLASEDGGITWQILRGNHTSDDNLYDRLYDGGYTGSSNGWLAESISLRRFRAKAILLRFELLSDSTSTYRGMAIDDLRVNTIKYQDGFESPDRNWHAEGWIRTDNRLPPRTWIQIVQDGPDGLTLQRFMRTSSGEMTIDLLPGGERAVVAISPVVPVTGLDSQYSLEFNLVDSAGAIMFLSRDCTVMTTHGLNFRDGPNGNKIGLVPAGTATTARDRRGDWFQIEYDDTLGWISAGYVTMQGNCN